MAFANGRRISELKTLWGEGFVEFHHEFLHERFPHLRDKHVDISSWLKESGSGAKDYYQKFFTLFLKDGILFENFLLDKKELNFTKEIVLPAIINIEKATGKKPLIVALEPTKHEGDKFWNSYPPNTIDFVNNKLK
jgi:hypothetical protein